MKIEVARVKKIREKTLMFFKSFQLTAYIFIILLLFFVYIPVSNSEEQSEPELEELLNLDLNELSEIKIISVSKRSEAIINAPATVRVITAEQIRERGYFTLEQALADLPGIQFRNPLSLNSYVFIRGIPNQNNLALILIDGIEINELNSGGFYAGGQYNLANVKRIEVVYGPASALYGTNAVSGIINIVTKDPEDEPSGLQIKGAYGGFNSGLVNPQFSNYDPEKRFGLRVSGMFKTSKLADLTGKNNDNAWTSDLELFEKDYSLDSKIRFRDFLLGLNYQNRISSSATYYPSVGTVYQDHDTYWNLRLLNGYLQHRYSLSDKIDLQSRFYGRETTVQKDSVREITNEGQFGFFRPNFRLGAEIIADGRLHEDFNLIAGIVLENDWLSKEYATSQSNDPLNRPPHPAWPDIINNRLLSSFIEGVYKPVKLLQITSGLRFDYSSVYDIVLTPRAGLIFNWLEFTSKFLYGRAFRAPKPWDFTDGKGNNELSPEKMQSFELSLAYLFKDLMRLETLFYQNRLNDLLSKETFDSSEGVESWRWSNKGHVNTQGVESLAEIWIGQIRPFASYTYTRSRDNKGNPVPEIAEHTANSGISYYISEHLHTSLWSNFSGPRLNPKIITATNSDKIDSAFVINGSLSFLNFKGFDFQVVARNLLNESYYHSSNRSPERYRQPQFSVLVIAGYNF